MLPLYTLAFLLGVLLFQQHAQLPAAYCSIAPLIAMAGSLLFPRFRLPAFLLIGYGWAHGYALVTSPESLPAAMLGTDVLVSGTIHDIPRQQGKDWKFLFDADAIELADQKLVGTWRFSLSWYNANVPLHAGERWQFRVKLREVHGFMNPGGFDYEAWRYRQGVRYQGYIRADARPVTRGFQGLHGLRHWIARQIANVDGDMAAKAVMRALVIGDKSGLGSDIQQVFQDTGTSHLMAISGLHVGLVAGMMFILGTRAWRLFPRMCRHWPAGMAGAMAAITAAAAYAALAGFTVPTQRALVMLTVVMVAMLLRRRTRALNTLSLALMGVLLLNPVSVMSAGFWLSFNAVAMLLLLSGSLSVSGPVVYRWARVQFGITLGLLPILLFWKMDGSLVSPLVNLVAIPLFGLVVVPLALLGSVLLWPLPGAANLLLSWCGILLEEILNVLTWTAGYAPDIQLLAGVKPIAVLLAFVGVVILLAPRVIPGKIFAGLLLLPLFSPVPAHRVPYGDFRFNLLDVGQGLAAVVRTENHTLVFDTGPRFSSGFETGSAVVAPFLKETAVKAIDRLIVSHSDSDHAGGVVGLQGEIPVLEILAGEPGQIRDKQARKCEQGQYWHWDGVEFEVLYPPAGELFAGNNASCVLRVATEGGSLLLTGDIEKSAERWLLGNNSQLLNSSVVVAPHHGSKSSSSPEFVAAVSPEYVLFPVGFANRWGFPAETVTERWVNAGARLYTTARSGSITMQFGAEGVSQPVEYRAEALRYWHHL